MVIRYSNQLLEHLSEIEEKIQIIEKLMEQLDLDCDREGIIRTLLTRKFHSPSGQ